MSIHVFPTIPSPTAVIFSDLSLPKSLDDDFRTASLRCLASMAAAPVADDVCTPASNNAYRYTVWYHVGRRVGTHDGMRSRVYRRCEVENEEDEMTNIDAVESRINTGIQTRLCFFFLYLLFTPDGTSAVFLLPFHPPPPSGKGCTRHTARERKKIKDFSIIYYTLPPTPPPRFRLRSRYTCNT